MSALYPSTGTALGLIELCSIARGFSVCDAMVKRAAVTLVRSTTVHPGKFIILIRGGVDEVYESVVAGRRASQDALIDDLILPNPHDQLVSVLDGQRDVRINAIGVFETYSVASVIRGADAALKAAEVEARSIRLADGLGGKGYFVLSGALHDVEEAVAAGIHAVGAGLVAGQEIIANPHPDLLSSLS